MVYINSVSANSARYYLHLHPVLSLEQISLKLSELRMLFNVTAYKPSLLTTFVSIFYIYLPFSLGPYEFKLPLNTISKLDTTG